MWRTLFDWTGQKVEHYEIATYGTLCTWAEQLGYRIAKNLLGQNMKTKKKLTNC